MAFTHLTALTLLLHPVVKPVAAAGTLEDVHTDASAKLFDDACAVIPGGVNSPVRAFKAVGGTPRFITEAHGCWLTDADGNRYVDLVCSWGPMILGHAPRRNRTGRRDHRPGATGGADTSGQLRHRGHHERGATGPRLYRPRQGRQVLRLLPRPRRRLARRRRLRGRDAGPAVVTRRHRRQRGRHNCVA